MPARKQKPFIQNFVFIIILLAGLSGGTSAEASPGATIPQVNISAPSYPIGIDGGEVRLVPYRLTETGNVSGEITSRTYRFYTQYDVPLGDVMGPYPTSIKVGALQTQEWNESVYLPRSVVEQARTMGKYALVMKTTFVGKSSAGAAFSAQTSLLLLLPPDAFSKTAPANGSAQSNSLTLQWNGSVGAVDYEYCVDTIDNNACDTAWNGTYDTRAALPNLPGSMTFYWQVRANNTSGTTYADSNTWWSFTTACGTITVSNTNDSGPGSLRQAILEICSGGIINFDPALAGQTITLTASPIPLIYQNLTIDGSGLNPPVIVSGGDTWQFMDIKGNASITISDLVITRGAATAGGALHVSGNGQLTLKNSTLYRNESTASGGAISVEGNGPVTIINSTFYQNQAGSSGGAISVIGNAPSTVVDSTFFDNTALGNGGALYHFGANITVTGSTLRNNHALGSGGAIHNTGRLTLKDSAVYDNETNSYGGAFAFPGNGPATIVNSTVAQNLAGVGGGAIYTNGNTTVQIFNSTFAYNGAPLGREVVLDGLAQIQLANTIFVCTPGNNECYVIAPSAAITYGADSMLGAGPLSVYGLGALDNNGGPTKTMALFPTSMLVDAGNDTICSGASVGGVDQRGVTRPQGAHCDIGAYEADGTFVPTPTATPTDTPTNTPTFTPTATPPYSYHPLYLSLANSQTVGGVAAADEDILKFDGTNWSLFFDGSDVGVASPDLFAFSLLDADTILMSFNANVTVNGIAATPQDVLRFDATSLGSTTAGTWSLYFDGSDVGLSDATTEKIDSLSLLPDGRLLISTTGNPVVPGVSGGRDEDVLAFTPTSLGDVTSGTWSLYFDGSDVGLSETSGEDVDALDVVGSNIYLSTQDNFSVPGLTGADEDVFVCTATSLGDVTACNYSPDLYFDGSTWGLAANDVDAFNFLGSAPAPTALPTGSPMWSPTPSPSATNTPTRTPTSTGGPTATPSPTRTSASTATTSPTLFVQVVQPNGGETLIVGTTYRITWNSTPDIDKVWIGYKSCDSCLDWIATDIPNAGYYDWNVSVGNTINTQFKIYIAGFDTGVGSNTDVSDSNFSVLPALPSLTPTTVPLVTVTPAATTFTPLADAYVNFSSPLNNYGTTTTLRVDASPDVHSYLRFNVQGLSGKVTKATLRVYANSASSQGCTASIVTDNTWSESTLNYNNAPPVGSALGSSGAFGTGVWISMDVTAYIAGNGTYNLALTTPGSTAVSLGSRESGATAPQLIVETVP